MPEPCFIFLGDIVARPGRNALAKWVPQLRSFYDPVAVIANGENVAAGRGIHANTAQEIFAAGVDVITLGDHTFDQRDSVLLLSQEQKILRPANFPHGTPGRGFHIYEISGYKIGVMNLMGRTFINQTLDCPFQASRQHMALYKLGEHYDALLIDAHTEATSEVACLGHIWDGYATAVLGTHTHCPTADGRVLPGGTAFQSDVGMCGVYDSSLGMGYDAIIKRFERGGRFQMEPASGEATLCGAVVFFGKDGLATSMQPLRLGGALTQQGLA